MGKILDNLSFNLPELPVQTSDPNQLFEGEPQLEMQKAQRDIQSMENLRAFAGQVLQTGSRVAAPIIQRGKEAAEKAGVMAGEYAAFNVSGDTFEERNNNFKLAFKQMRANQDIGLVDDPYFIRGLHKAQGVGALRLLDQEMTNAYERMKQNPTFFSDPDMYETEMRRLYDTIYVSLPDSIDAQEGFLSKSRSLLDNYNLQYKKESNQYNSKEYLNAQGNKVGAIFYDYILESDNIDQLAGSDLKEKWLEISEIVLNQVESGELSREDLVKYIPEKYADNPVEYFGKIYQSEEDIRNVIKSMKFTESVQEVQEVYDDLYNFADQGMGGLGVDPTDAILSLINSKFASENAGLAMSIINNLQAGTGKLGDTDKGKNALLDLKQLHEKQALAEQRDLLKRDAALQTQALKGIALPLSHLDAMIGSFDEILSISDSTPDGLRDELMERLDTLLKDEEGNIYDVEEYAKRYESVQKAYFRAISQTSTQRKQNVVLQDFTKITEILGYGPMSPQSTSLGEITNQMLTLFDADSSFTNGLIKTHTKTVLNNYIQDPVNVTTANEFWNTATMLQQINQTKSGSDLRISPMFENPDMLVTNPGLVSTLVQADNKGLLGAFVKPGSVVYDTVKEISESTTDAGMVGSPEIVVQFQAELVKKQEEQAKAEEKSRKQEIYRFSPTRIPLPGKENTITYGGARDLIALVKGAANMTQDDLPDEFLAPFVGAYASLRNEYLDKGYSEQAATAEAAKRFSERFEHKTIFDKGWGWFFNGDYKKIRMIVDNEASVDGMNPEVYWQSIEPDEDKRGQAIWDWIDGLRVSDESDIASKARAWLGKTKLEARRRVIDDQMNQFDQSYKQLFDLRPNFTIENQSNLLRLIAEGEEIPQGMRDTMYTATQNYLELMFAEQAKDGLDSFPAFNEQQFEGLAAFITQQVVSQSNIGFGLDDERFRSINMPTTREGVKQILYNLDKDGSFGFNLFNPKMKEKMRGDYRRAFEQEIEKDGIISTVKNLFGEESAELLRDEVTYIEYLQNFDLDSETFNYDSEDFLFVPTGDGRFFIKDSDGNTLNYKNGGVFTINTTDIGDRLRANAGKTYAGLWKEVGPIINPEVNAEQIPDEQAFMEQARGYFRNFPDGMTLYTFNLRFKDNGLEMYRIYKAIKEEETTSQSIPTTLDR